MQESTATSVLIAKVPLGSAGSQLKSASTHNLKLVYLQIYTSALGNCHKDPVYIIISCFTILPFQLESYVNMCPLRWVMLWGFDNLEVHRSS